MFLGQNTSNYASLSVTHSQWSGDNAERVKFLPKISLVYQQSSEPEVVMGDVNGDELVDVADVTGLIAAVLSGDTTAIIVEAANMNGDSAIDIEDVTSLINRVLMGR